MTKKQRSVTALLFLVLLPTGLTSCGAEPPALCQDMDAVIASANAIRDVNLDANAPTAIANELANMHTALTQLGQEASTQFAPQIDAVKTSAAALGTSVGSAAATPSSATLTAVRDDARALQSSLLDLQSAVQASC